MARLVIRHSRNSDGVRRKREFLNKKQIIELLELSGQLLSNGYPVQDLILLAPRLKIITEIQAKKLNHAFQEGQSLAQGFATIIDSPNLIMQLEIAEQHGNLAGCCQDNAQFMREEQKQLAQLRSLIAYPILLLVMMTGLVIFIQTVLRPQLQSLLPREAQTATNYWPWLILGVTLILLVFYCSRLTRQQWRYLVLKIPIIKPIFRSYYNFIIFTDLAHLLGSGLSLQEILNFVSQFSEESLQSSIANDTARKLDQGKLLTQIIDEHLLLPQELELLLAKGDTRKFQTMELQLLAKRNFIELERRLKSLIEQVQPLLFVIIALMIGTLYLQILIPIYDIMKGI